MSEVVHYDPIERQKQDFLHFYRSNGLNIQTAARAVGWDSRRIRALREEDDDFLIQMDEIREEAVSALESKSFERALNGDPTMLQFMLKHNKPEVYNPAVKVDLTKEEVLVVKDFTGQVIGDAEAGD